MATNPSSASTLPGLWVIETLASFKQVDASLLIDLVKRTPEISDDVGKNAREMVSLRILERLFAQGVGMANDVSYALDAKIGLDPSERCEDVLRRILHETSASNLRMARPEMLKWDFQSFINHKRSCLPKCTLQQLKDAILEGSHPLLASLKERSGLAIRNQSENRIPVDCDDSNGIAWRPEESSTDAQTIAAKGNLTPENFPNRNLLPAKRVRSVSVSENLGGPSRENEITMDNVCIPYSNATKKLKQDVTVGKNSGSLNGTELIEDSSGIIEQHIRREGCDLSKEPQARGLEESRFPEDGHDEDAASKRLGERGDVDDAEFLHNRQKISCNDNRVPQHTYGDGRGQNMCVDDAKEASEGLVDLRISDGAPQDVTQQKISVDEAKDYCEHTFQQNASNGAPPEEVKNDMEHNRELEMSGDSDGYHNERIDIATRKHNFLSSQCTYSQDSLATADCTELNLCMKCNKGGQLLVCSANACPLVVHENCLGSEASFDGKGDFYCPFCAYSRAISEYLEVKKKASLARKDLAAFIGSGIEHRPKKFSKRLHRSEQNHLRQDDDLNENNEANNSRNYANKASNPQCRTNIEDKRPAEPSVSHVNPPCGEKGAVDNNVTLCVLTEDKREGEKMVQESQSARELEGKQIALHAVDNCDGDNSSCRDTETVHGGVGHGEIGMQQEALHQPKSESPQEPGCPPNTDVEESSEEENDKSVASNYSIRFRKREKQYTYPAIPQLRRKKLPWIEVEENTLKEGVQRFTSVHDRKIPWKKILEFGSNVFQKGRTTIDLKDKWRNICKGSPKSK